MSVDGPLQISQLHLLCITSSSCFIHRGRHDTVHRTGFDSACGNHQSTQHSQDTVGEYRLAFWHNIFFFQRPKRRKKFRKKINVWKSGRINLLFSIPSIDVVLFKRKNWPVWYLCYKFLLAPTPPSMSTIK